MVRRIMTIAVSAAFLIGYGLSNRNVLYAQEAKKADTKAAAPKKEEPKAPPVKKEVPKSVQDKIDKAWTAIAEAVVAAQEAGLIETTIDPPPVLDILITGRAEDIATLKDHKGVSPEVFGAWFTGFGKLEGYIAQKDVRIIQPSGGLQDWYDRRKLKLAAAIDAVKKANKPASPEPKKEASKPAPVEKKAEPKKEVPKPAEPKKEAAKPAK